MEEIRHQAAELVRTLDAISARLHFISRAKDVRTVCEAAAGLAELPGIRFEPHTGLVIRVNIEQLLDLIAEADSTI